MGWLNERNKSGPSIYCHFTTTNGLTVFSPFLGRWILLLVLSIEIRVPTHKMDRFMNGQNDDVRLPFSVLDPIVGDVFSVLWEPEMIRETGSALKILTGEVLSQLGMTVLQATIMTGLMSALQWPISATMLHFLLPLHAHDSIF